MPSHLGQELLDEAPLALGVHGLADDTRGGRERQVGDLCANLGQRTLLLGRDVRRRALAQLLELGPRRGHVALAVLVRDALGAGEDVLRLAACLGEHAQPLRRGLLAIDARLVGVAQALLDPRAPLLETPPMRLNATKYRITRNTGTSRPGR